MVGRPLQSYALRVCFESLALISRKTDTSPTRPRGGKSEPLQQLDGRQGDWRHQLFTGDDIATAKRSVLRAGQVAAG